MTFTVMNPTGRGGRTTRCGVLAGVALWCCGFVLLVGQASGVHPSQWVHTTEADFSDGTTENTVVTNLGDIKLAAQTDVIGEIPEQAGVIYDLETTPDGVVYVAVGPEGGLLRRQGQEIEQVLTLGGEQIFCLGRTDQGKLLVAISADRSRVAVLEGQQLQTLVELEGVRYIWDMLLEGQTLYLATGPDGKLLAVDLQPTLRGEPAGVRVLLDAAQNNLLCLAQDGQGRIYVGSDTDGLLYRITPAPDGGEAEIFVLYDAPEPEIGALLVLEDGTIYAGTADAEEARPGRLEEVSTESGRPERPDPEAIPSELPQAPPRAEPQQEEVDTSQAVPGPAELDSDPRGASESSQVFPKSGDGTMDESRGVPHRRGAVGQSGMGRTAPSASRARALDLAEESPAGSDEQGSIDRLRRFLEKQLREAGVPAASASRRAQPQSTARSGSRRSGSSGRRSRSNSGEGSGSSEGNAIYRVSPAGFVTEVFRESVMILKLMKSPRDTGELLVATGNEGQIFQVDPVSEETVILADLEPEQVPAMLVDAEGHVLLGTANPATLVRLEAGYAKSGDYTSSVLDATQISLWGKMNLVATVPPDTTVAVQTRSGNVEDPDQAAWSDWSMPIVLEHDTDHSRLAPRELAVSCAPGRFLQYRLTFDGGGQVTPVVDLVQLTYMVPNLRPVVSAITASYPGDDNNRQGSAGGSDRNEPSHESKLDIEWQASDANQDQLLYTLEYQPAGIDKWLLLGEDLSDTSFQWETRFMPDGRYVLRVTASDHPDNTSDMARSSVRRSDPVLIDNSSPELGQLEHRVMGRAVKISAQVHDRWSPVAGVSFMVDAGGDWQPILPDDLIYDSTHEAITINIDSLDSGPHVVTVRVQDDWGNARYEAVLFDVP